MTYSMILNSIIWDFHPEIINFGSFALRWYSLAFAMAFVVGYKIIEFAYLKEGLTSKDADIVALYMGVAVVLGARLGHVFFYEPAYYMANPSEILMVWHGGLASHGASIGILIAMLIYSRTAPIKAKGYMWMLDRIILTIPVGVAMIRLGNLMNSEIYGKATDLPWGFVFVNAPEAGLIPRHPTQIYEAIGYLLIFVILFNYYKKRTFNLKKGSLFGLFLMMLFGLRFFVEFLKENQVDFESSLPLNMGQLLSIPFILAGAIIYFLSTSKKISAS